jgi:8-oxo-dGTP diphosphatase
MLTELLTHSKPEATVATMPRPTTPEITADIIIELPWQGDVGIVLIERRFEPFGWAIPGGFVDVGETLEHAAIREALEETCLHVTLKTLLGCYSDPQRDPRGHTVSAVYVASAEGTPRAEDDAKNIALFQLDDLPQPLAFDHARILDDYAHFRQTGEVTAL